MTQGCQLVFAYLNGIPCWCAGDDGHAPPCTWPDVTGYANANIQVNQETWPGTTNFRFSPTGPPILEPIRTGNGQLASNPRMGA